MARPVLTLVSASLLCASSLGAQPSIARKAIPPGLSDDVKAAIESLYSRDPVERGNTAIRLGAMGPRAEPAIPFLAAMLEDRIALSTISGGIGSPSQSATEALVRIGPKGIERLVAMARDKKRPIRLRNAAIDGMRHCTEPPCIDLLAEALADPSIEDPYHTKGLSVRANALQALAVLVEESGCYDPATDFGCCREPSAPALRRAIPGLVEVIAMPGGGEYDPGFESSMARKTLRCILGKSDPGVLDSAGWRDWLTRYQREATGPRLDSAGKWFVSSERVSAAVAALGSSDVGTRRHAAILLGLARAPKAVEPLTSLLFDEREETRDAAAWALASIGAPKALEVLSAALADDRSASCAASALGRLGANPASTAALIGNLRSVNVEVRGSAAVALGRLKIQVALPSLVALLEDRATFTDRSTLFADVGWDLDQDAPIVRGELLRKTICGAVADSLVQIGDRSALRAVEKRAANETDPGLRGTLARAARELRLLPLDARDYLRRGGFAVGTVIALSLLISVRRAVSRGRGRTS